MKLLIHNYENELVRLATDATEIKVAVAFLTEGGLNWLPEEIAAHVEFIVGIDLGITTPSALKSLQSKGVDVRVYSEPGKLFHPKAIYLRSADEETLIIGSNNLTSGGIASNHEVSLMAHRNESSEDAFGDFLAYFESLKTHECCGIPDERFYKTYSPTALRMQLVGQLQTQPPANLRSLDVQDSDFGNARIGTLGDFIRLLAQDFPRLERRIEGTVNDHPLKILNDEEFRPLFEDIVSTVSQGRLKGHSQLNIGGQWYRIPNILAVNENREPWEYTSSRGRLILQIHFSEDFGSVFLSLVLQYNLRRSLDAGEMPQQTSQRYQKLLEHVEHSSAKAKMDLPVFRHWNYKDTVLWGKPLMSFEYLVDSLPSDKILLKDLRILANVVNGASAIT